MDILKWSEQFKKDMAVKVGHSDPKTTTIYTHISKKTISRIKSPITNLKL
jgi:hypothetical protein